MRLMWPMKMRQSRSGEAAPIAACQTSKNRPVQMSLANILASHIEAKGAERRNTFGLP
jgi:hypothetical protein